MNSWTIFIVLAIVWGGCKQQSGKTGPVEALADTASFYPIADFIQGQIEETDLAYTALGEILFYSFADYSTVC